MAAKKNALPGFKNNFAELESLFQDIIDFLPAPTFAIDTECRVILWNKAIEDLTGIKADRILGMGNYEHSYCLYGERKPHVIEMALSATNLTEENLKTSNLERSDDNSLHGETTCLAKNGEKVCYLVKASPLYSTANTLIGAIATLRERPPAKESEPFDRLPLPGNMNKGIIASLQKLLDEKTEETVEHAFRINALASEIGRAVGLSSDELHELTLLAALHDVGKIAIPDSIILKSEKLSPEEWDIMKKHSEIGYNMTQSIPELAHISEKILHHHEWWNGEGYPHGLSGDIIPLLSRIIAVADAYDVMTSGRSYKKAFPAEKALEEIKNYSGIHFDPTLVDVFIKIHQEFSY